MQKKTRQDLNDAIESGSLARCESLVAQGVDVNEINCHTGQSPLGLAVSTRIVAAAEILDLLVRNGADVNAADPDLETTPLEYLLSRQQYQLAKVLIHGNIAKSTILKSLAVIEGDMVPDIYSAIGDFLDMHSKFPAEEIAALRSNAPVHILPPKLLDFISNLIFSEIESADLHATARDFVARDFAEQLSPIYDVRRLLAERLHQQYPELPISEIETATLEMIDVQLDRIEFCRRLNTSVQESSEVMRDRNRLHPNTL